MAESTLSINYDGLRIGVGAFLGYGRTIASWSAAQAEEINLFVQAGVRQFYYPPAVEGVEPGFEWSFLNPVGSVNTAADTEDQDLPDDFGRILGDFVFEPQLFNQSIVVVSVPRILNLRQYEIQTGRPKYAAIRSKEQTAGSGQRFEVLWWPKPDAIYALTYRYEAFSGALSAANPYPLGGMRFSELVLESCLAVAEQRANDEKGLHSEAFARLLSSAVAQDKRQGARYFGHMGGSGMDVVPPREALRRSSLVTYKGDTW